MNLGRPLITVILILGFCSGLSQSIRFDVKSEQSMCFSENLEENAISVGTYHVVNPHQDTPLPKSHRLDVWVRSIDSKQFHKALDVETGEFKFTATERGIYMTCFYGAKHHPTVIVTVDFDWKTVVAVSTTSMADIVTKNSVDIMGLQLKRMMDSVMLISKEMSYLRERRLEMQEVNESTNSKMFWLSLLSILACLSVAGLQLWYLSNYLKKKKLI